MSKTILACVDESSYASAVCDYAIWAAKKLSAPMSIVHVLDKAIHTHTPDLSGSLGLGSQELLLKQLAELDEKHSELAALRAKAILAAAKTKAEEAGLINVQEHLLQGAFVASLNTLEDKTRLLVLGKRGFSSEEAHGYMGLHVERVIRNFSTPLLLTQQRYKEPRRIMLAYDASATADKIIDLLADSALCDGLPVHLVMAADDADAQKPKLDAASKVLKDRGFHTKTAIVAGEPDKVLHEYQQEHHIDLMVMGAYGHSRIRQFIVGSTTSSMISKAKSALLILR